MLYLLDANVLITADNNYYPIDRFPEFWDWILDQGKNRVIKIPLEIIEEIEAGRSKGDRLIEWMKKDDNRSILLLEEEPTFELVQEVIKHGYSEDLADDEIEQLGRDPFLIAYAIVDKEKRCVVTTEVSKPSAQPNNRKVPDACKLLRVQCCNTFKMMRDLDFKTSWNQDS